MLEIQFNDLLDFCFKELPPEKQKAVAVKILSDRDTFSIVRGINILKRELGEKAKVEAYLADAAQEGKERFFKQLAQTQ